MGGKEKGGRKQIEQAATSTRDNRKESSPKIQVLVLLLLGFDAHLGVELVRTMSVFGESLGENRNSLEADCSHRFGG